MIHYRNCALIVAASLCFLHIPAHAKEAAEQQAEAPRVVHAVLNGLAIDIDATSGSILKLAYPGAGTILEATREKAGLLDIAYPLADFEPFRLGSTHSSGAKVKQTDGAVTIAWEKLGGSRPFEFPGKVSAFVKFSADPDGRSVTLKCTIKNQSQRAVPQVLFPDLHGFVPLQGKSETKLRSGGMVTAPFRDIKRPEGGGFYPDPGASGDVEAFFQSTYSGGMLMRWFDFGNLQGGLSCWQRFWGYGPEDVAGNPLCRIRMELDEFENKLRICWMHAPWIPPGGTWESRPYVLTQHEGGWAKGIDPFRQWVKENQKRQYPVPGHIRDGLGFRSLFMCNWQPKDGPRDVLWKFSDLPKVAEECREHGLTEMVLWFWHDSFQLPMPPAFAHLGGQQELLKAAAECKRRGVPVSLFISVVALANPTAARYGLGLGGVWTYHPEFVPRIGPFYAVSRTTGTIDVGCEPWQKEVLAGCKQLGDAGLPSICWDVYLGRKEEPNLFTLTRKIRAAAKQKDPESTFSGEASNNLELESEALDYTWNWVPGYVDYRAFSSVFSSPRLNVNINHSVADASLAFMDNLFLNVMPRKTPYGVNGTGTIAQYPDFDKRLKQCANLRRQFLDYFTGGTLIGECLLARDCPDTHVNAYVGPGKALLLVLNKSGRRQVRVDCKVDGWLKSANNFYRTDCYDMDGKRIEIGTPGSDFYVVTKELDQNEIAVYEITAQ
jgi:hypothetical protein